MMRNLFVWTVLMVVPIGRKDDGSWNYTEKFTVLQLVGFVILCFGVLVYNEIVVIPYWGFNKYTRIALEEREKIQASESRSIEYVKHEDRSISGNDLKSDYTSDRAISSQLTRP